MSKHHHCISGCRGRVEPGHLVCARHWRMVPKPLRDRVVHSYGVLKATGAKGHWAAERVHRQCVRDAIAAILRKEGRI